MNSSCLFSSESLITEGVSTLQMPVMGEGFILLTSGYGFMGGVYHPPFDTLKIITSTYDMKIKLYK